MANRTAAVLHRLFKFGIRRDMIGINPASLLELNREAPRERVLTDAEIASFWNGLDGAAMVPITRLVLRFLLVTAARSGEAINAEWAEIDADLWEIPAGKSKNGRAHQVPLSPLAIDLLDEARAIGGASRFVFPSAHNLDSPLGSSSPGNALRMACRAVGPDGVALFDFDSVAPHDRRRTAASQIAALCFPQFVVARVLNHAPGDVTGVHYNKYTYTAEKRTALEAWSRRLQAIFTGQPAPAKVVPLHSHSKRGARS